MPQFEYKIIPAPTRGEKQRGLKTTADRFAHALTQVMNDLGRDGWDYVRADTLPCEERSGFTGRTTTFQNMLVFRRELTVACRWISQPWPQPLFLRLCPHPLQRPCVWQPSLRPKLKPPAWQCRSQTAPHPHLGPPAHGHEKWPLNSRRCRRAGFTPPFAFI